ncbi:MAG: hypothetical protein L3J98_06850 [Gammaproteobacteria bacterium]|nr:hypothetical protein [Gammaproteobacteria bacterium]MCF6259865.1 hypothetical protein [Gammaproteobacteria bacterium]
MNKLFKLLFAGLLLWTATAQPVVAEQGLWGAERNVVINGQPVIGPDLMLLDVLNGELIPPGRYWLNIETGAWGYEGGPQQGVINEKSDTKNRYFEDDLGDFCVRNPGICP